MFTAMNVAVTPIYKIIAIYDLLLTLFGASVSKPNTIESWTAEFGMVFHPRDNWMMNKHALSPVNIQRVMQV